MESDLKDIPYTYILHIPNIVGLSIVGTNIILVRVFLECESIASQAMIAILLVISKPHRKTEIELERDFLRIQDFTGKKNLPKRTIR